MTLRVLEVATLEIEDAIDFYNKESPGLGFSFADEILRTLQRVYEYPKAWTSVSPVLRRCIAKRFPYAVIYGTVDSEIVVVAVAHLHRNPESWKTRVF